MDQINLFVGSGLKVVNILNSKQLWLTYVASKGSHKEIKKYAETLEPKDEKSVEDLLKDHKSMFKKAS